MRKGLYLGGVIRHDLKVNLCKCGGKFEKNFNPLFKKDIPLCNKCERPPQLLMIRITLPGLGKSNLRYDHEGNRLNDISQAITTLNRIHEEIKSNTFDKYKFGGKRLLDEFKIKRILHRWFKKQVRIKELTPETIRSVRYNINALTRTYNGFSLAKISIQDLEHNHLEKYLYMEQINSRGEVRSKRAKSKDLEVLRSVLNSFKKNRKSKNILIPDFPSLENSAEKDYYVDAEAQRKVLKYVENHKGAIETAIIYMMRPCEVRALKWIDIDFKKKIITIQRHFSGKKVIQGRKSQKKTDKGKYAILRLPLVPKFIEILNQTKAGLDQNEFIFKNAKGKAIHEKALNEAWKKACIKSGEKIHNFYDGSRHASATRIIQEGTGTMDELRELLGHTDRRTTNKYAKIDSSKLSKILTG